MEQIDFEQSSILNTVLYLASDGWTIYLGIGLLLLLLFFYILVSGSEAAFFSVSIFQSQQLRESENRSERYFSQLMEKPMQLLGTILLSKFAVLFAIIFLTISEKSMLSIIESIVTVCAVCCLTEIFVKRYAKTHITQYVHFCAYPIWALFYLCYPITIIFAWIFGNKVKKSQNNVSLDEISDAIENVDVADSEEEEDARLLKGVVRFGDTGAKEIMKARSDVVSIEKSQSLDEVFTIMFESGYTRFPVFEEDLDHIIGTLVFKDFLPHLLDKKPFEWQLLIRPAFFVSEKKMIDELLQEFQKKKVHLAIVVDEYGGTSGIVTLEDVLEEIVGEISDEYDAYDDDNSCRKIDDRTWEFEAKTNISDFSKMVNCTDDDYFDDVRGDTDSLGGLVLELLGKTPQKNDEITYGKYHFRVVELDHRRILKLLITISDSDEKNNHDDDNK